MFLNELAFVNLVNLPFTFICLQMQQGTICVNLIFDQLISVLKVASFGFSFISVDRCRVHDDDVFQRKMT